MKHINKRKDIVSRRAFKKSVHAAERQEAVREIVEQLPNNFFTYSRMWNELNDPYPHEHRDDWMYYRPFTENTIGGKFLSSLINLGLIAMPLNSWGRKIYTENTKELFAKLSVAPSGYIYVENPTTGEVIHYKLDKYTPHNPFLKLK